MATVGSSNKLSNEEIEAKVDEFAKKLEILRVRYEQYFIGVEKTAPSVMRMDVVRIMRELEQIQVKNTAIKFKIRQNIQKFTSYSTYWNRTLREIEDGRYKRHVDKAKRNVIAAEEKATKAFAPEVPNAETMHAVADEAEAFLASLGLGSSKPKEPEKPKEAVKPKIVNPATARGGEMPAIDQHLSASDVRGGGGSDTRTVLRSRRPTIVQSSVSPAIVQPAVHGAASTPASQSQVNMPAASLSGHRPAIVQGRRPAIVQSATHPAIHTGVQPSPAAAQSAVPVQPAVPAAPAVSKPPIAGARPAGLPPKSLQAPSVPKPPTLPTLPKKN